MMDCRKEKNRVTVLGQRLLFIFRKDKIVVGMINLIIDHVYLTIHKKSGFDIMLFFSVWYRHSDVG